MTSEVVKSPDIQGSTPITTVYYKCEDCGDVSQSQASLNLHRSVCHSTSKSRSNDSEVIENNSDILARAEQIAESCECPKCGEHLLLLREHDFSCALCEFQDTDQSRFFVHLKEHYEPNAVLNVVEPGSVIIEQVIDGTNDFDNQDHDYSFEPDDRDDPEYVPDNDDTDDDDVVEILKTESKTEKPKLGISWKSSKKEGAQKKLDFVRPIDDEKENDAKKAKSKIGISWHTPQEKGAPKKLSFVKTPVAPSKTADIKPSLASLKNNSAAKRLSADKTPSATSKAGTVKKEPGFGTDLIKKEGSNRGTTKWVRLEDIKYLEPPNQQTTRNGASGPSSRSGQTPKYGARQYAPSLTKLLNTTNGPSPTKGPGPTKESSPTKRPGPTKEPDPGSTEKTTSEDGPKKKAKKSKEKKPKPPREKKVPVCGVCKRIFSTSTSLKLHLRIHTGEKNYTCEHCGKAFTQWSTCQQHIASIHSGIKKYTCEFCGASFARSTGLALHRRMHTGENTHHCNVCGKGFRCKSYLDRHRTFHTGEKRYKCEFCFKTFRTSTDMKRHRNSVHFGLGNVSLTVAKELLITRMDGLRTAQRPTHTVVQRYVNENSTSSDGDTEEVIRATTIITGSHYEL